MRDFENVQHTTLIFFPQLRIYYYIQFKILTLTRNSFFFLLFPTKYKTSNLFS